jgi:hypothetical protein
MVDIPLNIYFVLVKWAWREGVVSYDTFISCEEEQASGFMEPPLSPPLPAA